MSELDPPGMNTAEIYEEWYARPELNPIHLQPGDPPTTIFEWYRNLGLPAPKNVLDAGCGSGRNLPEIQRLFPGAIIDAFDASPAGIATAQTACPETTIVQGDLHKPWPFTGNHYDLVASITTISPESTTTEQLRRAGRSALEVVAPGGYWLDEGIEPNDEVARQFPVDPNAPIEEGTGAVVLWQYGNQIKPERTIGLSDAIALSRSLGAMVIAGRVVVFEDAVFGSQSMTRRFVQLILQRPPGRESPQPNSFIPTEGHITPGFTNDVQLVADNRDKLYVQKTVRPEPGGTEALVRHLSTEELVEVGFVQPGIITSDAVVYARTGPEQQALCERLDRLGIRVAVPIYADTEKLITPHIAGQTLWEHLQDGKTSAIMATLQSLHRAHGHATYGGEPWAGNFIVSEDEASVIRIDFEVAIEGKTAAELEMAQLLYSILGLTTNFDASLARVISFVGEHTGQYDWTRIYSYIMAYERYFSEHPNGQRMERAKHRLHGRLEQIAQVLGRPDASR